MNNELFRGKHQTRSSRCPQWDYRSEAAYFVTICTKDRKEFFGEIRNGIMGLNDVGCMTAQFWQEIPQHFPYVQLDEWVIMPNHVHGILIVKYDIDGYIATHRRDVAMQRLYDGKNPYFSRISPQRDSLSVIIRSYKSVCTRNINEIQNKIHFAWQPRFHDHIVRDDHDLNRIRQYIRNNPMKWERDRNNLEMI